MRKLAFAPRVVPVLVAALWGASVGSSLLHAQDGESGIGSRQRQRAERPILDFRWARGPKLYHVNTELAQRMGANRLWYSVAVPNRRTVDEMRREFEHIKRQGMPVVSPPGRPDVERMLAEHPEWEFKRWRYLTAKPVEGTGESLTIPLLDGYYIDPDSKHAFHAINWEWNPKDHWRVLDLTADEVVPASEWDVSGEGGELGDAAVTLRRTEQDHQYTVAFLAGQEDPKLYPINLLLPEVLESEAFWESFKEDNRSAAAAGANFARGIGLVFLFDVIRDTEGDAGVINWYGYARTITTTTRQRYREQTGRDVDPLWWVHRGRTRTVDDPPSAGYLEWMSFIQDQVRPYARAYNDWLNENDVKGVFFWGDGWIGMEPYMGMVEEAGYREIAVPANSALDVRRATDFYGPNVSRVIRIWEHSADAIWRRWDRILQGALYHMPDGVSFGNHNPVVTQEQPDYKQALEQIYREFDQAYRATEGTEPFRQPITLYVVNAWGKVHSWPRAPFAANPSQLTLQALADLPLDVQFISLREVAEEGVPADADVLLNIGEPGSSWSGDHHWTDRAAENVRQFVRDGGGLIGVDAPSLNGDRFVLEDVFGVQFKGLASEAAERGVYRSNGALFEEYTRSPGVELAFVDDAPQLFAGLELAGTRGNVHAAPADGVQVLARGDAGEGPAGLATINTFGQGRAAYIGSYGDGAGYEEFLKRLIYHVADADAARAALDSPTPGAHVYFYPEANVLFVYNRDAPSGQVEVHAAAVAEAYPDGVELRGLYHGREEPPNVPTMHTFTVDEMKAGVTLEIPQRHLHVYRLRSPMGRRR